jgi:hypothetical protein
MIGPCFDGEVFVKVNKEGEKRKVKELKEGDQIYSSLLGKNIIEKVITTKLFRERKMVYIGDSWITRGHPIYIEEGGIIYIILYCCQMTYY